MQDITFRDPPTALPRVSRQSKHKPLFDAFEQNPTRWVAICLEDFPGGTVSEKASSLRAAAKYHGVRISTTMRGPELYARFKPALAPVPTGERGMQAALASA
jgi:hypothetical protein